MPLIAPPKPTGEVQTPVLLSSTQSTSVTRFRAFKTILLQMARTCSLLSNKKLIIKLMEWDWLAMLKTHLTDGSLPVRGDLEDVEMWLSQERPITVSLSG